MSETTHECPYGAGTCPKIEELESDVNDVRATLSRITTTLYFIAGIVSVTLGVSIL